VRAAAEELWLSARARAARALGDAADATELLEKSVEVISRYLDCRRTPLFSTNTAALLTHAFKCQLRKQLCRSQRIESVGGIEELEELAELARDAEWSNQVEASLDLQTILRKLSPRACTIILLRAADHHWPYIANRLGISVSTAKNSFWQEIRKIQSRQRMVSEKARKDDGKKGPIR
jgi:DNA-directed RNA polymerase specialized sigma24 family protein